MNKEKEEILEELRTKKDKLQEKTPQNIVIQNIKLLGTIQLTEIETNKEQEGGKTAKLYLVEEYNKETDEIMLKYYADDEFIGIDKDGEFIPTGLAREKYEESDSIKDVLENLEEKEETEKDSAGKEEKHKVYGLKELEEEKQNEEKDKDEKETTKNDLTGEKPTHVMQTIDVDSTYVDNWTTVSRAFDLPPEVKYITIAYPMQKDDHVLSSTMTMYMLDNRGNIIENVRGKTIRDYFEIDDATGHNPMYDDNTKLELEGDYAEKNIGQTMRRFKSKEAPDLYLSIEQKEVGGYHEVYAGGRTLDGNDPVEVQLETRNVSIQTDLEMQEIISTYAGQYNRDEMDKEADGHKGHGKKIPVEYADGEEKIIVFKCKYIPGTDKTWKELSDETGENIQELQGRFVKELKEGREPEDIVKEIEYDYEMVGHEHKH